MKRTIAILLAALASACQPAFINGVPNEDSPYFEVPVDSRLVLKSAVTVLAREDRAYFQNGKIMPWPQINIYGDYCVLQLEGRREVAQTVTPDEFLVRKVGVEQRFYLGRETAPRTGWQFASRGAIQLATLSDSDESSTYRVYAWVMQLQSSRQPDVLRMSCASWGTPQGLPFVTVHKVRHSLGDFFQLELFKVNP